MLGVQQRHPQPRAGHGQGQPWKARPGAHVDERARLRQKPGPGQGGEGVHIVRVQHFRFLGDGGKVHAGVPVHEQAVIRGQALGQFLGGGYAALGQPFGKSLCFP